MPAAIPAEIVEHEAVFSCTSGVTVNLSERSKILRGRAWYSTMSATRIIYKLTEFFSGMIHFDLKIILAQKICDQWKKIIVNFPLLIKIKLWGGVENFIDLRKTSRPQMAQNDGIILSNHLQNLWSSNLATSFVEFVPLLAPKCLDDRWF